MAGDDAETHESDGAGGDGRDGAGGDGSADVETGGFETTHRVVVDDARSLDLPDESVELVVTSPPYPMIEMWDGVFADLDPAVADHLAAGDGEAAFRAMHDALAPVWDEIERVLAPGGIACINVGDATRKVDGEFRLWPNHAELLTRLSERGLSPLPDLLWRKPSNRPSKFVGSGTLPPNAYVALEHEYVLPFRKGGLRSFPPGDTARYESAFFWEERNDWFSDLWEGIQGTDQTLSGDERRDRSAAFPLSIPYRLVCMFSVYGDTVLDPFLGTGTTSLAAMAAGRNSVGYERDPELAAALDERVDAAPRVSRRLAGERLDAHREFVADDPDRASYESSHYDFEVVTKQERELRLYAVDEVEETTEGYRASHRPFEG